VIPGAAYITPLTKTTTDKTAKTAHFLNIVSCTFSKFLF
jgi:hypothetical protein